MPDKQITSSISDKSGRFVMTIGLDFHNFLFTSTQVKKLLKFHSSLNQFHLCWSKSCKTLKFEQISAFAEMTKNQLFHEKNNSTDATFGRSDHNGTRKIGEKTT